MVDKLVSVSVSELKCLHRDLVCAYDLVLGVVRVLEDKDVLGSNEVSTSDLSQGVFSREGDVCSICEHGVVFERDGDLGFLVCGECGSKRSL